MRLRAKPIDRDLYIDAVRVASVVVVVLGHWFTTTVIWDDGHIGIENALSVIRAAHPATWLIQVMPLLFFVGGFSNARSLELHDGNFLAFLRTRYLRLLSPTVVFVGVWIVVGVAADVFINELPNPVDRAADLAALPFWFLGLYVIVVALAPPMLRLHRQQGWWVPAGLAAGVVAVDVLYHGFGVTQVGVLNYAFVWLLAHQLGFFYGDGTLLHLSRRVITAAALIGLGGLVALTKFGAYPVSMVGVPGDERWNTNPPSLALVMLTVWLICLALLVRPRATVRAGATQQSLARANRVLLTVFLWHVSAVALAGAVLYPLGFPEPETGTAAWWALRPLWIAALVPPMILLVAAFRRFEIHPAPSAAGIGADTVRYVAAGIAVVSIGIGILGFGVTGFNRIATDLGEGVLGFELNPLLNIAHLLLGVTVLWSAYRGVRIAIALTFGVSALHFATGWIGVSDGITILGMNPATAWLHVALGAAGVFLVIWAVLRDRRILPDSEP